MGAFGRGLQGILGSISQFIPSLGGATSAIGNFANSLGGLAGRASGLMSGMGGLAMVGGALAVALPVVAIGAMAAKIFEATAAVQTMKASLTTVIGDAGQAGQAFDALAAFAAKTPFTLDQAVTGFTKLVALGLTPSERAMTSYGNTAAAMGKDLNQMIEAVADASTGEFERLKEFGIKSKVQGDEVAFTFQGVTTTVGNNSKAIQDYLIGIGETQFAGGMERQAKTLSGAMSTLGDTIFLMFAKLGEGDFANGAASAIEGLANIITTQVQPALEGMMDFLSGALSLVTAPIRGIADALSSILPAGQEVGTMGEWIGVIFSGLGAIAEVMGAAIGGVFQVLGATIGAVAEGVASVWNWAFGETNNAAANSANLQGKAANGVKLRWIDSARGMIAGIGAFAKGLPTIIGVGIDQVGKMFTDLGNRISKFFSGDFGAFDGFLASLKANAGPIMAQVQKVMADAMSASRSAAFESASGGSSSKVDLGSFAKPAGGSAPSPSGAGGSPRGGTAGVGDAAREADALAKRQQQYWESLEKTVTAREKLVGLSAAEAAYQTELNKAADAGVATSVAENQARIAGLLYRKQAADLNDRIADSERDAENARMTAIDKIIHGEEKGAEIGKFLRDLERDILFYKSQGIQVDAEALRLAGMKAIEAEKTAAAIREANSEAARLVKIGSADRLSAVRPSDSDLQSKLAQVNETFERMLKDATLSEQDRGKILQQQEDARRGAEIEHRKALEDFNQRELEAAERITRQFEDAANNIASGIEQLFGRKAGSAAFGLSSLIGTLRDQNALKKNGYDLEGRPLRSGLGQLAQGLQQMTKQFPKLLGEKLSASLGKALGQAGIGAEIGGQVAQVGKLFWGKFSNTGSQLGGAAGMMIGGPIGSLIGSTLGGIVGGLLKKTPRADAKFGFTEDGRLEVAKVSGSKKYREAVGEAGNDVVSRINSLAEKLGASVTQVQMASIGMRNDEWRVDTSGRGITKVKNGAQNFGDDRNAAIEAVVRDALKKGILTGMSDFSNRIVKLGTDAMVDLAIGYETVLKELEEMNGGYESAVKSLADETKKLMDQMRGAGATAQELSNVQEWSAKRLEKLLDEQIGGLRDFRKSLDGEGSGVTKLSRLMAAQAEFAAMRAKIDAGETIDNSRFTSLGQEVFGLARDVYGTATAEFQAIRNELIGVTDGLINSAQSAYDRATAEAAQATATNTAIANDYLAQIAEAVRGGMVNPSAAPVASGGGSVSPQQTVNGRELWNGAGRLNLF